MPLHQISVTPAERAKRVESKGMRHEAAKVSAGRVELGRAGKSWVEFGRVR